MGFLQRQSFSRGWVPDADAVGAPADALLRFDNGILDELGVLAVRPGSVKVNAVPFGDLDVHSLYTALLNGTRYRMAGISNQVYVNGSPLVGMSGANDVAFGAAMGQVLMARSGSKYKFDGAAVRTWGIAQTGDAPTVAPNVADRVDLATCDDSESPALVWDEDDGTGATYAIGVDGTANGAAVITPSPTTNRGVVTRTFGSAQDWSQYGSTVATDDDLLTLYVYLADPTKFSALTVMVDVNEDSANRFQEDYYAYVFRSQDVVVPTKRQTLLPHHGLVVEDKTSADRVEAELARADAQGTAVNTRVTRFQPTAGWNKLFISRGQLGRVGFTHGKGWDTVIAVRVIVESVSGGGAVQIDNLTLSGGALSGDYRWIYVFGRDDGTYVGKSAPSPQSAVASFQSQSAVVTIPADGARDGQINRLWLFRTGGVLRGYTLTQTYDGVIGTGAVTITDGLSDVDALILDEPLEIDNTTPPDDILGIAGPYFDRIFALTATSLYPSRRLNPDSFATGQVIRIAGAEETAFWIKKAFGGLYIGTSRDIYRVEGDGAELPDGTVNFLKTPLNVDHPPISDGVVQDGSLLIYLAADGWRAVAGSGTESLSGSTSLLYQGQTRHGRGPVAATTGRFRAAVTQRELVALTPEGGETTATARIYRRVFAGGEWRYHEYPQAFRSLHREPDGTLLAGDAAGTVWILDRGISDGGTAIPITWWTKVEDDAAPFQRKDLWDLRCTVDTGGATASVGLYLDGSASAAIAVPLTQLGMGPVLASVASVPACRQIQLRLTGTVTTFRWAAFGLQYRARPMIARFAEPKPATPSAVRRRFGGLTVIADTLGTPASIVPVLDEVAQTAIPLTTTDAVATTLSFNAVVGRDLWARVTHPSGLELYDVAPIILETLPQQFKGTTARTDAGYAGQKVLSGIHVKLCTLGRPVVVTPVLDGVTQTPQTIVTGATEPEYVTLEFTAPTTAVQIALSVSGNVELYEWTPMVTARRPLGVKAWDSGPLDLGRELVWPQFIAIKVRATRPLVVTPYFDGVAFTVGTGAIPITAVGADTVITVPLARGAKGYVLRLVITSDAEFFPYWIEVMRRNTAAASQLAPVRIPALGAA